MSQFQDLKQHLNAILQNGMNGGASVSGSALTLLSLGDVAENKEIPIAGSRAVCGNGMTGPGTPGERQVNDPAQDSASGVFPHITQSETTVARFDTFVVFGFNDTNNAFNGGNTFTGYAFSSDSGVTWSDCGNPPKGSLLAEDDGDPVLAVDSNGIFYFARIATATSENQSLQYLQAR